MLDVLARVLELLGRQRPRVPAREARRLGQPDLQHVVEQAEVPGLRGEAGEARRDLRVEDVGDVRRPLAAQDRDVLAAGVQHDLDRRVGEHAGQRREVEPGAGQRVQDRDLLADDDLHEAQQRAVAALGHELRVDARDGPPRGRARRGRRRRGRAWRRTLSGADRRSAPVAQQHLDRLSSIDAGFLAQEGPTTHMHIGAVIRLEGPPPEIRDFLAHVRSRLHLVPRYRQKLATPPMEAGLPLWVDDPTFNLEYHVRHTAMPAPGDEATLLRLAARIFSQRLDRTKPLWELWLVEGLSDGGFALISKSHHALVDGVSGVDLGTVLFDVDREGTELAPAPPWVPKPEPTGADLVARGLQGAANRAIRTRRPARSRRRRNPTELIDRAREVAEGLGEVRDDRAQPAVADAVQRRARPAPAARGRARRARRVQGDQGRAGRHGQRRRARRRRRRPRPLHARARHGHGRASSCARASRCPPARATATSAARQRDHDHDGAAARRRRRPDGAAAARARGDGRPQGVQAGARREGDRRTCRTSPRRRSSPRRRG